MNKHRSIVIIGNVGSGKSTFSRELSDRVDAELIQADELFKTNPFFPLALTDRVRWSLTSDLWFLFARIMMYEKVPMMLKNKDVVIDSGLPMSYVYAHSRIRSGYFTRDEWSLYELYFNTLVTADLLPTQVVYLHAPVEFLLERIKKRGRAFEIKHHSREYLETLNESLDVIVTELKKKGVSVATIDVTQPTSLDDFYSTQLDGQKA